MHKGVFGTYTNFLKNKAFQSLKTSESSVQLNCWCTYWYNKTHSLLLPKPRERHKRCGTLWTEWLSILFCLQKRPNSWYTFTLTFIRKREVFSCIFPVGKLILSLELCFLNQPSQHQRNLSREEEKNKMKEIKTRKKSWTGKSVYPPKFRDALWSRTP